MSISSENPSHTPRPIHIWERYVKFHTFTLESDPKWWHFLLCTTLFRMVRLWGIRLVFLIEFLFTRGTRWGLVSLFRYIVSNFLFFTSCRNWWFWWEWNVKPLHLSWNRWTWMLMFLQQQRDLRGSHGRRELGKDTHTTIYFLFSRSLVESNQNGNGLY